jgi:hypothetical protein
MHVVRTKLENYAQQKQKKPSRGEADGFNLGKIAYL